MNRLVDRLYPLTAFAGFVFAFAFMAVSPPPSEDRWIVLQIQGAQHSVQNNKGLVFALSVSAILCSIIRIVWSHQKLKHSTNQLVLSTLRAEVSTPVGTVCLFAGTVAPPGWLFCDGSPIPPETRYDALRRAIGTRFDPNLPAAHFLPDLRGRVPVGAGTGRMHNAATG